MNNTIRFLGIVLIALNCCNSLKGQTKNAVYQSLEIGDEVPDVVFGDVGNTDTETIRLSDLRGKLLILDFWTTYCGACIASWPKLLELQERFNDRIQIVLVNASQGKDVIEKTMETQKRVRNVDMTLPYIANDTVLRNQLFPGIAINEMLDFDSFCAFIQNQGFGVRKETRMLTVLAVSKHQYSKN